MYCPKCAAQNLEDAKFCRACGVDISLVPQAVAGELAQKLAANEEHSRPSRHSRRGETPSMESGVANLFLGVAFFVVAYMLSQRAGSADNWWFYMLIPAFICLGKGIGALARISAEKRRTQATPAPRAADTTLLNQPPRASALPPRETGEIIAPPTSVTDATTRHLGVPVERTPKDV